VPRRRVLVNTLSLTHGGGRSYVVNLLRELDRDPRGFEFSVLTASGQLSAAETGGLDVTNVRLPSPRAAARVVFRVLYEETLLPLRAARFDLLYCLADLAPAVRLVPTVVALRNLNIYDRRFYDTARLRILERMVRLGLRRADRVVFPSRAAAELITKRIPLAPERIVVIPHGISAEAFRDDTAPPAADVPPYLFLPASLERHKNIPVLLECLAHVEDRRLQVWIAGGSETDRACEAELHRIVESLRLETRVRFLGRVPYSEILHYYRGAVALVFPSLIETFGHPLLEAMLAGTPILAADIPAFREIADDAALYFPPRDPVRLARLVDEMRREPGRTRARVERGRLRAREFSWSRSIDRLCAVFEETLGSRRSEATEPLPRVTDETL
jgi:glycosyltransferase involved in cell wall biosynthesis